MSPLAMSPYALLATLALLSAAARALLPRGWSAPTAAPASIMAIGIFGLAALQQIPSLAAIATLPLAILLLVLWGHIALSFVASAAAGRLGDHLRPPVGRFAIGTWVAGTAVLARMVALALPAWAPLAAILAIVACAIWLWFVPLMVQGFRLIAAAPVSQRPSGVILLSTVSTQSLATVAFGLFPDWPALCGIGTLLVILGYALYALGTSLILRRYLGQKGWRLADDWENPNCILHGAMSITGLAAVMSGTIPFLVCYGTWLYTAGMFVLVEAVEVARLAQRWRRYGWRRGLCVYHVSQWSRNFTFGMFYAFTLAFARAFGAVDLGPVVEAAQAAVLAYGPYVVLAFLLVEIGLFASARLWPGARPMGAGSPPHPT